MFRRKTIDSIKKVNANTPKPKFEVWRGANGMWWWHLKAANGKVIANGEGYYNRQDAYNAINNVTILSAQARIVVL